MRIGVPAEIKPSEARVAITPSGIDTLTSDGHDVVVQAGAGLGSGYSDEAFAAAGATVAPSANDVWDAADLILKVKEPITAEFAHLREGLTVFAYLHLAVEPELTRALLDSGATSIAFEGVERPGAGRPLLTPMSEVAGRLSVIAGATHLQHHNGGSGVLLGGIPGAPRAQVTVIGGGVAGEHAAANALGLGAQVTVIDIDQTRLAALEARFGNGLQTRASTAWDIHAAVAASDLVIGSVLIPGATAPKLVTADMVEQMRPGSVLVDIAIDQGGCFEGSEPRTHDDPTYRVHDALYYSVANMPGAMPATATVALANATLPYVRRLASAGVEAAAAADPGLAAGIYTQQHRLKNRAVAEAVGLPLG